MDPTTCVLETSYFCPLFVLSCPTLICRISPRNLDVLRIYGLVCFIIAVVYLFVSLTILPVPASLRASWDCVCLVSVHCEASEWGPWSPCMKKGKTCGFKRGTETRVREILQHPSAKGNLCPPTSETRTCIVQRKKCSKGERGTDTLTSLSPHSLICISLYSFIWDIWHYSSCP